MDSDITHFCFSRSCLPSVFILVSTGCSGSSEAKASSGRGRDVSVSFPRDCSTRGSALGWPGHSGGSRHSPSLAWTTTHGFYPRPTTRQHFPDGKGFEVPGSSPDPPAPRSSPAPRAPSVAAEGHEEQGRWPGPSPGRAAGADARQPRTYPTKHTGYTGRTAYGERTLPACSAEPVSE